MVLATVALGHELTYLLAHGLSGYDAAMAQAGHQWYWFTFVLLVGCVGFALTVVAARQLIRLRRLAAGLADSATSAPGLFRGLVARIWLRTALGAAAIYYVQENIEAATAGLSPPGLGIFAGDQLIALPAFLLVGLVLALIATLVLWRQETLLRRLRSAAVPTRRQAPRFSRTLGASNVPSAHVSAANGVRAPPKLVFEPV